MASFDLWDRYARLAGIWWSRHGGPTAAQTESARLEALVEFARERSPFYRRRYRHVPRGAFSPRDLPVVRKPELMASFDEWVTDDRIHRADIERFIAARPVGERFLDQYVVFQSSGTSGTPGLFVQDGHALAVYDALVAAQMAEPWLAAAALAASLGPGALIAATHGHFASIASWKQSCRAYGRAGAEAFAVLDPLPRLVARLDRHAPAFIASYPSVLALLAEERAAGRLHAKPSLLWSGGEFLAPRAREHIERAFDAPLVNEYGASECLSIAASCSVGNLHVHAGWVLLEAVDRRHRPVRPGETAHTTLVTNLANWVQPVIRYDLGDRVTMLAEACPCGDGRPALRVEGRTGDTLRLRAKGGSWIAVAPMALACVLEDRAGVHRFQVVQTAPDAVALRLPVGAPDRLAQWKRARPALHAWLDEQGLGDVRVALDRGAPRAERSSGKLRTVVGLAECRD